MGLTPLQTIDLINQHEGRTTGPPAVGYVDEHGSPVVPQWSELEPGRIEVPGEARAQLTAPVADNAVDEQAMERLGGGGVGGGPTGTIAPTTTALQGVTAMEHVGLSDGRGFWHGSAFALTERELGEARRIGVGAIRREVESRAEALVAEVGGLKRKPRGPLARPRRRAPTPPPA